MNNKRSKFMIVIIIAVSVLIAFFCHYIVKIKLNENRIIGLDGYLFLNIDRSKFDFDIIKEYTYDAPTVLEEALKGFYKWDQLPLTNHFKDKFKYNRRNIIKDIYACESLCSGIFEKDDENMIEILCDKPDNLLTNIILPPIRTVYLFKYNIVDGKLDDVELVEKYNVDATTGKRFFVKDDPLKFEP